MGEKMIGNNLEIAWSPEEQTRIQEKEQVTQRSMRGGPHRKD